ncbi:MAG TPA: OmpH family outer membrane protein [Alphaproteobacteria bacterium]|nr:OmpH family outer membrane protein [Alphaproteobacteria bacterium]
MSHSISLRVCLLTAVVAVVLAPAFAKAEGAAAASSTGPKNIAVLDLELVVQKSDAGQSIQKALNGKEDALKKDAEAFKKSLREKEQKLLKDRKGGVDEKTFEAEKKAFEEEIKKSQKSMMEKSAALEKTRMQALRDINEQIAKVTADIADERKLQMVVDRKFVVIAEKDLDITEEVLNRLNKAVKSIPLK